MLPAYNRRVDTGDLRRFITCLQVIVDDQLQRIDTSTNLVRLDRAPESAVDAMLADLGNPFAFDLDLGAKRRLAAVLVDVYRLKGTAVGIRTVLRFFLGLDAVTVLPFSANGLVLGESILGESWVLGPSDRFSRFAFNVAVPRLLSDRERAQLRAIVDLMRPAHTHFVELIEPVAPAVDEGWVLGVSEVGDGSVLAG